MECSHCSFSADTAKSLAIHSTRVHVKTSKYPCISCNKEFKSKSSFYNHANSTQSKIKHFIYKLIQQSYVKTNSTKTVLHTHIIPEYKILAVNKTAHFKSDVKLNKFINDILLQDKFNFVSNSGTKHVQGGLKSYHKCNYKEEGKHVCEAFFNILIIANNNISLEHNNFHNHEVLFDQVRISKHMKEILIEKIKSKVGLDDIYQSILDTIDGVVEVKTQMVNMSYLRYLKNGYTIPSKLDKDDLTSLNRTINNLVKQNSIKVLINNFSENKKTSSDFITKDFLFCFQTQDQDKFVESNSHLNTMLVDSTHGTNIYNYKLISISVLDDNHRATSHLFCNHQLRKH